MEDEKNNLVDNLEEEEVAKGQFSRQIQALQQQVKGQLKLVPILLDH